LKFRKLNFGGGALCLFVLTIILSTIPALANSPVDGQLQGITNQPPVANANGPYVKNEGTPVGLDAHLSSDPDGDTLQYRWDLDNDGTWDTGWLTNDVFDHTWHDDWSGTVKLEVSDGTDTDTDTASVTINNEAPVIDVLNAFPTTVYSGGTVNFYGHFKDRGTEDTHTIDWTFGDGNSASGTLDPTNIYYVPGVYSVTLRVEDDDGGVDKEKLEITVLPVFLDIDVKPGSWPNSINLNGNGVVAVGVFGSEDFDVVDIDVDTVRCGVNGKEASPIHKGHIEDINGDGIDDMVFHFREYELGIAPDTPDNTTMPLYLKAQLLDGGGYIEGKDIIRVTPNDEESRDKVE